MKPGTLLGNPTFLPFANKPLHVTALVSLKHAFAYDSCFTGSLLTMGLFTILLTERLFSIIKCKLKKS